MSDCLTERSKRMRNVKLAVVQMRCSTKIRENLENAEQKIRLAAAEGAEIVLLP